MKTISSKIDITDPKPTAGSQETHATPVGYNEWVRRAIKGAALEIDFCALGLTEKAGEVAGKIKRLKRGDLTLDYETKMMIALELGDVLWYLTALANNLGFSLGGIMDGNVRKLEDRRARGQTKGTGDNR